jgi:hypothetical protein
LATEDKFINSKRGAGIAASVVCSKAITITVSGNSTVKDSSIVLPAGSVFHSITLDTPTAITGTPTTCNFRCGTADAGQTIVADVDAKAAGKIAATIVAALDTIAAFAAADTTLFCQVVTSGGTASAGPINVRVNYAAPVY